MSERWREPPKIEAIEHDSANTVLIGDTARLEVDVTVSAETFERMRSGYICAQCYEPHETPFPVACTLCGFPMGKQQLERLAAEYAGKRWLGPQQSLEDELEGMSERAAQHQEKSRIVLPPGVSGT